MYFVDQDHKQNFEELAEYWYRGDAQSRAACYIFAHPVIWRRHHGNLGDSPVEWTFGDDQGDLPSESESMEVLSSAFLELTRAAVEMFTGRRRNFDIAHFLSVADENVYAVFVQAMDILKDRLVG